MSQRECEKAGKSVSDAPGQDGSLSAFSFAAEKGAEFRALFDHRRPAEKPRQLLQSFESLVPVATVAEESGKGSGKRKAEEGPAEEKDAEKRAHVENNHQVGLLMPVQKQPRRVLAFELYVMDKTTVKRSAVWFTHLSDQERRGYFELEVRREQIAEAQRNSLEKQLARPKDAPSPSAPKQPAKKGSGTLMKRVGKKSVPAAAAAVPAAPAGGKGKEKSGSELAHQAYEEFIKECSGYMDSTNTFVLRSDEELRRMFSQLSKEQTSVYFNRAYSKKTAK